MAALVESQRLDSFIESSEALYPANATKDYQPVHGRVHEHMFAPAVASYFSAGRLHTKWANDFWCVFDPRALPLPRPLPPPRTLPPLLPLLPLPLPFASALELVDALRAPLLPPLLLPRLLLPANQRQMQHYDS